MSRSAPEAREKKRGSPLPDDLRQQLQARFREQGLRRLMLQTGLSRGALERALGGLDVYRGTVALIRSGLASMPISDSSCPEAAQ